MITPLMHILSSLNDKFETDRPVNILYLNKSDRDLILSEAARLCDMALDENVIATMDGRVFETQYYNGQAITLNPYTMVFLERLIQCAKLYKNGHIATEEASESDKDLSAQSTVLLIESNPDHIYYYVYKMMSSRNLTYDQRIQKLQELLIVLNTHSGGEVGPKVDNSGFLARIELQSHISYWKTMLMCDVMRITGAIPEEPFTEATIETIREQLKFLGFYGFVNPMKMYKDFSGSRVTRKSDVNVPDYVLVFLAKVIQSGGGRVQIEDRN